MGKISVAKRRARDTPEIDADEFLLSAFSIHKTCRPHCGWGNLKHYSNRTVTLDSRRASMLGGAALFACNSHAQAPGAQPESGGRLELEEVVVTGTHLRGAEPVGSAVISVDREEIEAVGAKTTAQILQLQPQVFNLGISEMQRTGTDGAGKISRMRPRSTCAD